MNATSIVAALRSEVMPLAAVLSAILAVAQPTFAQAPLSLSDAVTRAHARNPDAIAAAFLAAAATRAAATLVAVNLVVQSDDERVLRAQAVTEVAEAAARNAAGAAAA